MLRISWIKHATSSKEMPANQKVMVENLESNNEGKRLGELNTQKFHTRQEKQKH